MFSEIGSDDFLNFAFRGQRYGEQLRAAAARTGRLCALEVRENAGYIEARFDFGFLGGTLGCAESEKLRRAALLCASRGAPLVIYAASGGVRMQEGAAALM